jgi:hypothetical protein
MTKTLCSLRSPLKLGHEAYRNVHIDPKSAFRPRVVL